MINIAYFLALLYFFLGNKHFGICLFCLSYTEKNAPFFKTATLEC